MGKDAPVAAKDEELPLLEPLLVRRKLFPNLSAASGWSLSAALQHVYGLPQAVLQPVSLFVSVFAVHLYSIQGASYGYLILGLAIGRAVDLVFAPVLASATDSFRSYYGRRRPFIFAGVWIYCLMLILLFAPPTNFNSSQRATWFILSYCGHVLSHSLLAVPYDALGLELADSYDERASLWWVAGGLYSNLGSAALFFLCSCLPGLVTTPAASSSSSLSCGDASSCFSSTGTGTSCATYFPEGTDGAGVLPSFSIFNATQWTEASVTKISALFDTSPALAAAKYGSCRVVGGVVYGTAASLFSPSSCAAAWQSMPSANDRACLNSYCSCVQSCQSLCSRPSLYWACLYGALVASAWLLASTSMSLYWLQDRSRLKGKALSLPPSPPLAACIASVLQTRAFSALLVPWLLDQVGYLLVTGSLAYYVELLLQPERQTLGGNGVECNGGLGRYSSSKNIFESAWLCRSENVTGLFLAALHASAFVSSFFWRAAVSRFGKKLCWAAGSLALAVSLAGWAGCSSSSVPAALGVCCAVGASLGSLWVSEAMLSDASEYHEFCHGTRLDGQLAVLRSLALKLASTVGCVFPAASLFSLGYSPASSPSVFTRQGSVPPAVSSLVLFLAAVIPSALALLSAVIKLGYPLRTREAVELVAEGVGLHLQGREAFDPLTETDHCPPLRRGLVGERLEQAMLLDCFPTIAEAEDFRATTNVGLPQSSVEHFSAVARDQSGLLLLLLTGCVVAVAVTFPLCALPSPGSLSAVPFLFVVLLGACAAALLLSLSRLSAALALQLEKNRPQLHVLDVALQHRAFLAAQAQAPLRQLLRESAAHRSLRRWRRAWLRQEPPSSDFSSSSSSSSSGAAVGGMGGVGVGIDSSSSTASLAAPPALSLSLSPSASRAKVAPLPPSPSSASAPGSKDGQAWALHDEFLRRRVQASCEARRILFLGLAASTDKDDDEEEDEREREREKEEEEKKRRKRRVRSRARLDDSKRGDGSDEDGEEEEEEEQDEEEEEEEDGWGSKGTDALLRRWRAILQGRDSPPSFLSSSASAFAPDTARGSPASAAAAAAAAASKPLFPPSDDDEEEEDREGGTIGGDGSGLPSRPAAGSVWELELLCFLREQRDVNEGRRPPFELTAVDHDHDPAAAAAAAAAALVSGAASGAGTAVDLASKDDWVTM